MKQSEIDDLSGAAFTTGEITRVRRIILDKTFAETKSLLDGLTLFESDGTPPLAEIEQSERKLMRSHLIVFYDRFPDGTTKLKGGRQGLDTDAERDKEGLRREIRLFLHLPMLSPEVVEATEFKPKQSQTAISTTVR
jgi:hypothetical protein